MVRNENKETERSVRGKEKRIKNKETERPVIGGEKENKKTERRGRGKKCTDNNEA